MFFFYADFFAILAEYDREIAHGSREKSEQLRKQNGLRRNAREHFDFFDSSRLALDHAAFEFELLGLVAVFDGDLRAGDGILIRERRGGGSFEYFFVTGESAFFESAPGVWNS